MSIHKLANAIKEQAAMVTGNQAFIKIGKIISYNPEDYLVQVLIDEPIPGNDETSIPSIQTWWIQIMSLWVGNGWGLFCTPTLGANCIVLFQDGSYQSPIGAIPIFNDISRGLNVPSGECWLVHQTGSYIKLTNDGGISINSNSTKLGNLHDGVLHNLVTDALISLFNNHVHSDSQGGTTGVPTVPLDISVLTVNTRAT